MHYDNHGTSVIGLPCNSDSSTSEVLQYLVLRSKPRLKFAAGLQVRSKFSAARMRTIYTEGCFRAGIAFQMTAPQAQNARTNNAHAQ